MVRFCLEHPRFACTSLHGTHRQEPSANKTPNLTRPLTCQAGIEDHAVFPLLATRMDVSKLQADHTEMDAVIHDMEQACRRYQWR